MLLDFLWKSELWPNQQFKTSTVVEKEPEVKRESRVFPTNTEPEKNLTNCSTAFLSGTVCGMDSLLLSKPGKAVGQCKSGSMPHSQAARIEPISVEELDKAERDLVHVQRDSFNEEISIIKNSSANIIKGCTPTTKKIKSRSQVKSPGLTHGGLGWSSCRRAPCKLPTSTGYETSYNSASFTSRCWSDYQLLPSSLQALWQRTCPLYDQRKILDCKGKSCSEKVPQQPF